jgi:hypothetical protein
VAGFPLVAQLGNGRAVAVGDEDRVVPEPPGAARLVGDRAVERAGTAKFVAARRNAHELADVTCTTALARDLAESRKQPADEVAVGCEPRRIDTGPAAESGDFEARVLTEHPHSRPGQTMAEARLAAGVVVVRLTFLRWVVLRLQLDQIPARQHLPKLAQLVLVARRKSGS